MYKKEKKTKIKKVKTLLHGGGLHPLFLSISNGGPKSANQPVQLNSQQNTNAIQQSPETYCTHILPLSLFSLSLSSLEEHEELEWR